MAYSGGVSGLKATKPAKGEKINPTSAAVKAYADHLAKRQDAALQAAGGGKKIYSYTYAYNGFAADLSASAAAKMASVPGVLAVPPTRSSSWTRRRLRHSSGSPTPAGCGIGWGHPKMLRRRWTAPVRT